MSEQVGQSREVIKPEVVVRWRNWGVPEDNIKAIVRQRLNILEVRHLEEYVTVQNYRYIVPRLPEIEAERWGFAKMIDFEGHIDARLRTGGRDKIRKIDRWIYRREYFVPRVELTTETYELTEEIANMMHVFLSATRALYRGKYFIQYHCHVYTFRAVRICHLTEPYLKVPKKKRTAREIPETYTESPTLTIRAL